MTLRKTFPALLIALMIFLFAPAAKAQCMGMNPKNCVRLNTPPARGQAQYHKSQKQVQKRVWVEGRYQYSRRGARWVPGRWVKA